MSRIPTRSSPPLLSFLHSTPFSSSLIFVFLSLSSVFHIKRAFYGPTSSPSPRTHHRDDPSYHYERSLSSKLAPNLGAKVSARSIKKRSSLSRRPGLKFRCLSPSWSRRRTSTSCQDQGRRDGHHPRRLSSRSKSRYIKEQETGVELLSKLVADRQLRQGGRQGQLYGPQDTALSLSLWPGFPSALSAGLLSK